MTLSAGVEPTNEMDLRLLPSPGEITVRRNPWVVTLLFGIVLALIVGWFWWRGSPSWGIYGVGVAAILGTKLLLSLLPAHRWAPPPPGVRVAVVIPIFNEDPAILARGLASIDAQSYRPEHVVVVDDGSDDPSAREMAYAWAETRPWVHVIVQENAGKREAMGKAFRFLLGHVDIFLCVDSDTVLERNAIRRGIAPLVADPTIAAATGTVVALNQHVGLLPRLLDLRYVNAFLYERAAYSQLGSVLCVCGSLAFWRAEIIHKRLNEFLGQTFLGQPCSYGDDRHMTNLSLLHGKVVVAEGAVARTAVPERAGHLVRQQIRWGKSFFRESIWALTHFSPARVAWWLSALELVSWVGFTAGLLTTSIIQPLITHEYRGFDYLVWVILAGYLRSVHVFSIRRPDWTRWDQFGAFLLAPVYGIVHVLVLMPLRLYSLITLRQVQWGTRGEVEVSI